MPNLDDVRRIASALPGTVAGGSERFAFGVMHKGKSKGFVWTWAERVDPKKPKVINEGVVAISVSNLEVKEMLLGQGVPYIFTEPHYDGYAAILVRLADVPLTELEDLIVEGWKCKAHPAQLSEYESSDR